MKFFRSTCSSKLPPLTLFVAASLGVVFLLAGCGPAGPTYPAAKLAGSVTIAGRPLPVDAVGTIQFIPQSTGQPTSAEIIAGKYEAQDVPIGKVTAIFNVTRLTGKQVVEAGAPTGSPYPERENLVPETHRSGITLDVTGDNLLQDFNL